MTASLSRALRLAAVSGPLVLALACSDDPVVPRDDQRAAPTLMVSSASQVVTGKTGPGALYALHVPAEWNGDLILFLHGYTPTAWPVALPDADPIWGSRYAAIRDSALAHGYAFAWSSNSENGLAIKDAAIRTRQLKGLFVAKFGRPQHTYLWGFSMGGAGALHLAEQNPALFDGVLAECGVALGFGPIIDQRFNLRVLFDYFHPGVIPGPATAFPADVDWATIQPGVIAAILANPAAAIELAAVDQVRLEYNNDFSELVQHIVTSLTFSSAWWWTGDIWARTNGHPFFDNETLWYTGSSDDAALNAGVARFTAHPSAVNAIAHWYSPSGRLGVPVLMIHTQRDQQVPVRHVLTFADLAAVAGSADLLVQRIEDRFGHCVFEASEEVAAMEDLARWVRTGVRPGT
jgi:pimeloyl-ACP methyl ester carboxylesterase